ncbi:transposase [Rhizobium beringeri]
MPVLRAIYRARDAEAGLKALEAFEGRLLGPEIPCHLSKLAAQLGTRRSLLRLPEGVRRIIYTTNAIEALNSKLAGPVRSRGHFPW